MCVRPPRLDRGSVIARHHDGRVVVPRDTAIVDSVVGGNFHISLGAFALNADETQKRSRASVQAGLSKCFFKISTSALSIS